MVASSFSKLCTLLKHDLFLAKLCSRHQTNNEGTNLNVTAKTDTLLQFFVNDLIFYYDIFYNYCTIGRGYLLH